MTPLAVDQNVVRMRKPRKHAVRTHIKYMSPEQLTRFLQAAREYGPREHCMFLFAVSHGARGQEICNLKLTDLDFSNGVVRIERLKGSLESVQSFMKVKGDTLTDEKLAFKTWLAARPDDPGGYVFNSRKSNQLSRVQVYRLFQEICRKAGIHGFNVHSLKHTCAMRLVKANINAFTIQATLGHRDIKSTMVYVAPTPQDCDAARLLAFSHKS